MEQVKYKSIKVSDKIPPINFLETIGLLGENLPDNIRDRLLNIILQKKGGHYMDIEDIIPDFDSYIESYLCDDSDCPVRKVRRFDNVLNGYVNKVVLENELG